MHAPGQDANWRVVRSFAHGVPEFPGGDGCVRRRKVRVSPPGGNRLPRPVGPASGSHAMEEGVLFPLLRPRRARCAHADLCDRGIQPFESPRVGHVGNGWTAGTWMSGCISMCVNLRLAVEIAGSGSATVAYSRESLHIPPHVHDITQVPTPKPSPPAPRVGHQTNLAWLLTLQPPNQPRPCSYPRHLNRSL